MAIKRKKKKSISKSRGFSLKEMDDLHEKIMKGMQLAIDRLIEEERKTDGSLVFERDGKIVYIKARDLKLSTEK